MLSEREGRGEGGGEKGGGIQGRWMCVVRVCSDQGVVRVWREVSSPVWGSPASTDDGPRTRGSVRERKHCYSDKQIQGL